MPRLDLYANFTLFVRLRLGGKDVLIGRGNDCDIQLPNELVSRQHARIERTVDGGYVLHNLSPNGTRVNSVMAEGAMPLKAGDRIYVENAVLIFQTDEAESEEISTSRRTLLKMPALRKDQLPKS
ncbi:MAG TPA: FHA domain-containing protein [Thermoanaerobaculia bacterium]|nr:FHA domain-containing protein [Thermoanaerobaculia bacterium]